MILPSLSAMMWYPLTSITSKGPGLYWVLALDGRYLRRTWSDIFIECGFTYGLLFFNNFCVFFLVSCLLRAYLMSSILLGVGSCGNLVRNFRPKRSSPGACPVVGCGVPPPLDDYSTQRSLCAKPFWKSSWASLLNHWLQGPLHCIQVGDLCLPIWNIFWRRWLSINGHY